jgi:hypothetical protein
MSSEANREKLTGLTTVREIMDTATQFEVVARDFYKALVPKVSKNLRNWRKRNRAMSTCSRSLLPIPM